MGALGIMMLRRGTMANPIAGSDYILSDTRGDAEVFRILMSKGVSSDGVGITKEDAAKVTSIGTWFKGNTAIVSFDELIYFTSVTKLENGAFQGCTALRSIDLGNVSSLGSDAFNKSGLEAVISVGAVTYISSNSFLECRSLKAFPFPISVTTVQYRAFYFCSAMGGDVYLPNATSFGVGAFAGTAIESLIIPKATTITGSLCSSCPQLKRIDISGATTIESSICSDCVSLQKAELGENVTSIGWRAFYNCSSLQYVICRAITPPSLSAQAFGSSCPIYVPDDSVDAYKAASGWSSYASRIQPLSSYTE